MFKYWSAPGACVHRCGSRFQYRTKGIEGGWQLRKQRTAFLKWGCGECPFLFFQNATDLSPPDPHAGPDAVRVWLHPASQWEQVSVLPHTFVLHSSMEPLFRRISLPQAGRGIASFLPNGGNIIITSWKVFNIQYLSKLQCWLNTRCGPAAWWKPKIVSEGAIDVCCVCFLPSMFYRCYPCFIKSDVEQYLWVSQNSFTWIVLCWTWSHSDYLQYSGFSLKEKLFLCVRYKFVVNFSDVFIRGLCIYLE